MGWTSPVMNGLMGITGTHEPLDRPLTLEESSWVSSLLPLGAIFGPLCGGIFIDKLGRKFTILAMVGVPSILGWILTISAKNYGMLYAARFLIGISTGSASTLGPVYVAEISSALERGTLCSLPQLMISLGILLEYAVGPYVSYFALGCINLAFSVMFVVVSSWVETILADRLGRRPLLFFSTIGCGVSLTALGAHDYIASRDASAVSNIEWFPIASLVLYNIAFSVGLGPLTWAIMGELFSNKSKSAAGVLCGCFGWIGGFAISRTFQPISSLSGAFVAYWIYAASSFAGFAFMVFFLPETKGKTLQEIQKDLAIFGPLCGGIFIDKLGRKYTLLIMAGLPSILGWILTISAKNYGMLYAARFLIGISTGSATTLCPVYVAEISSALERGTLCSLPQLMIALGILLEYAVGPLGRRPLLFLSTIVCGVSLTALGAHDYIGARDRSAVSNIGWFPIASLVFYYIGYTVGLGPLTWVILGELFTSSAKSAAGISCGCFAWIAGFAITRTFQPIVSSAGAFVAYWIYAACSFAGFVFMVVFLHETKCKTLQEIQRDLDR
ncbi:hypothetical protein J437_LFUL003413 [Ladona fulva]|uniref:Major facilitator superfamily (MFS) profile domain-containing protein n=1 Tax=Ladona fulva TaxID=123851 RepID=A0A8K0K2P1_LADFU|nr:hypothetical protein J437_LFUL003413 [Ladona fulva]